jgi:hypothetical protein
MAIAVSVGIFVRGDDFIHEHHEVADRRNYAKGEHLSPAGNAVRTEETGTRRIVEAQKTGAARRASLMPSNNGVHLPQQLARGADGVMAGFAYTDMLVKVFDLYTSGQTKEALDLHDALMPLMRYKREFPMVMRKESCAGAVY